MSSPAEEEQKTKKLKREQQQQIKDVLTPAFVINRYAFEKNCQSILEMARTHGMRLRPHVKTHKTKEGCYIQATGKSWTGEPNDAEKNKKNLDLVNGFVASTLPEISMLIEASAKYQQAVPFRDILYGVPISESKLLALEKLRQQLHGTGNIHILLDHEKQVDFVEKFVTENEGTLPYSAFLKLDTGYHRAGITCDERGVQLAMKIINSSSLRLCGVYSHCGHAYDEKDASKQISIVEDDMALIQSFLASLKTQLESSANETDFQIKNLIVSVGSTPSARHHPETAKKSDANTIINTPVEIHPGNYTLFDRQQLWAGSCQSEFDLAGRVVSRVIGHYEDRNTIMLDAGALALTKDPAPQGGVCAIAGHPELECYKMSQEVILVRNQDLNHNNFPFEKFPLGCLVSLLPNHSCLAAACFEKYYVIDDPTGSFSPDTEIIDEWIPAKYFEV